MMPRVNGWSGALAALLFLVPRLSLGADDVAGAAQDLARRTVVWNRGPITVTYRNLSSLPDSRLTEVRQDFEAALPRNTDAAIPIEARITLSENTTDYLLIEEARAGAESQVWIARWKRAARSGAVSSPAAIEKRLVWEQDEPILDLAFPGTSLLVLSRSRITLYAPNGTTWQPKQSVPLPGGMPEPRDFRGHLRVNGTRLEVYLPGVACQGSVEPALTLDCRAGGEPWVLESGSQALLLANFTANRNYFDGRLVLQNGTRKSVTPFYSAAESGDPGNALWLLAMADGRTEVFDGTFQELGTIPGWGSDLAGISTRCSGGSQVLADRPANDEPDAIQAYSIVNRSAVSLAPPVTFSGPITALWPSLGSSAVAVSHDLATGKYAAYVLTVVCGP